jgi:hypothetical protein
MNKLVGLAFAVPLFAGCGVDTVKPPPKPNQDILPDLTVPPAPDPGKGWQIITPIFDNINPGDDDEVCTWTDVIADQQTDIRSTLGYQNEPPGHHIIVFYTTLPQPAGTQRICNDADMASFRFVAAAAGEGMANTAPGNLVFRIPAGAQVVINHHYLNSSDKVLKGQSVVNINFADPNGTYTPSGYMTVLNSSLQVQPGDTTQTMHATLQNDFKLWQLFPHMHQWGKHTVVNFTHAGVTTKLYDLDWDPSFAFHAPAMMMDPSAPLLATAGDSIDMSCEWNNTTGRVLDFGFEMCVFFTATVDDNNAPNIDWDNGSWGTF